MSVHDAHLNQIDEISPIRESAVTRFRSRPFERLGRARASASSFRRTECARSADENRIDGTRHERRNQHPHDLRIKAFSFVVEDFSFPPTSRSFARPPMGNARESSHSDGGADNRVDRLFDIG